MFHFSIETQDACCKVPLSDRSSLRVIKVIKILPTNSKYRQLIDLGDLSDVYKKISIVYRM